MKKILRPLISVCLITYNHEKYIAEAIQSVLNQSFVNFELIIVNDGSTDTTEEIIKTFKDERIKYIYQENQGPSMATNAGILTSSGTYLALMSGDDVCYPERLEKQYNFITSMPEEIIVFSRVDFIDDNSYPMKDGRDEKWCNKVDLKSRSEFLRYFFFQGNCLNAPTCMVKKALILEVGLCNLASIQTQDFDMWIKLIKKYDIHVLPDSLIKYRLRSSNMNLSDNSKLVRTQFECYEIAKNMFNDVPLNLFKEAFFDKLRKSNFSTDIEYELEKAFIFLQNDFPLFKSIGTEKLFHLLQDENILAISCREYDFGLLDLYKLTLLNDITNTEQIRRLNESNDRLHSENIRLNKDYDLALERANAYEVSIKKIYQSTSWRLTKIVRYLGSLMNKKRQLI